MYCKYYIVYSQLGATLQCMASSGEKYDVCPAANALTKEAKISAFHIQKVVACAKAQTFVYVPAQPRIMPLRGGASPTTDIDVHDWASPSADIAR